MDLAKILNECDVTGNCHTQCMSIVKTLREKAIIRKIFNKMDPWGDRPWFVVEHPKGDYIAHYVVQVGNMILDPFLREKGPIPINEYIHNTYKNAEEVQMDFRSDS